MAGWRDQFYENSNVSEAVINFLNFLSISRINPPLHAPKTKVFLDYHCAVGWRRALDYKDL